jgi:ubiquinol-cytochrome c reductase cytochrome b subunit
MRLFHRVQVLKLLNQHLGVYPTPMNLNWNWSWGSLSGLILGSQIVTGILLAMHYVGHVDHAFASVQHLMVDVPSGMILRYAHANGASLFFTVVYLHVLRGLYYSSGNQPREIVWISGVVILLLMIITAFIGYVLPWGQMSFWGATVITSLATTIPVIGKQVVYWLWGGFSIFYSVPGNSDIIFNSLLDAGKSYENNLARVYDPLQPLGLKPLNVFNPRGDGSTNLVTNLNYIPLFKYLLNAKAAFQEQVKKLNIKAQSAGFSNDENLQRLHAEDLKWFVGFVEGDGCFSITKNGVYTKYEFSIEVSVRDINLLYKIKSILGIGYISQRVRKSVITGEPIEMARLKVSSKGDLIQIILPIFEQYPMLTNKQFDFLYFKECLLKNIIHYEKLPAYERPLGNRFENETDILNISYFNSWLIGFIEAEGYFSIFKASKENDITADFRIGQTNAPEIIFAICKHFKLPTKPHKDNKNYWSIHTSSIRGVSNVIKFINHSNVKFKGHKSAQYNNWLSGITKSARYHAVLGTTRR